MRKTLLFLCVLLLLSSCDSAQEAQQQLQQTAEAKAKQAVQQQVDKAAAAAQAEANKAKDSFFGGIGQKISDLGKAIRDWWGGIWGTQPAPNPNPQPNPNPNPNPGPGDSTYVIGNSNARGRDCAKISCSTIVTFKSGQEIQVSGTEKGDVVDGNNTWLRVAYQQRVVFVHSSLASPKASVPVPPVEQVPVDTKWIKPDNNFLVEGKVLQFSAHVASGTNVRYVNFTTMWPGGGWHIACSASQPTPDGVYACDWPLDQVFDKVKDNVTVPNGGSGPLTVSFDVYDSNDHPTLSPDGTRQEGLGWSPPMHDAKIIGFQPGEGDHTTRDFWGIDFTSSNTAVYPVRPGKVVYAQYNCSKAAGNTVPSCYGNVVVIDHGDGMYSVYTHLKDGSLPKVDDKELGINDQIGIMSNSGTGTGDKNIHLHFAVRKGDPNLGANALFGSNTPVRVPLTP